MRKESDFSKAKRGAVTSAPGEKRIVITRQALLGAEDEAALLEAIAGADRGETISPEELFARLDKRAKQ